MIHDDSRVATIFSSSSTAGDDEAGRGPGGSGDDAADVGHDTRIQADIGHLSRLWAEPLPTSFD